MNKEAYQQQIAECENRISQIKEDILRINSQYIETNREFADGEKVLIVTASHKHYYRDITVPKSERVAFIKRAVVSWNGDVDYELVKPSVSGQMGRCRDYLADRHESINKFLIN